MNLVETWAQLEHDRREHPPVARMQRRIVPQHRRDFFLALEFPTRNRMLVMCVSAGSVTGQRVVPECRGLTVRMSERSTVPPTAELELILSEPQLHGIFDLLIEDLVEVSERPKDERLGVTRFLERLQEWQTLFLRLGSGKISKESQHGLWGELWTLKELVAPSIGFPNAVQAWRGPLRADQDFQLGKVSLEVKTSVAHHFAGFIVASERQLDAPAGTALAIVAISLDARPGLGDSLPDLVSGCRSIAASTGCLGALNDRLALSGYEDRDAESYAGEGYSIRQRSQFIVNDAFPKIVPSQLVSGISEVKYTVSLEACSPFAITAIELSNLLAGVR